MTTVMTHSLRVRSSAVTSASWSIVATSRLDVTARTERTSETRSVRWLQAQPAEDGGRERVELWTKNESRERRSRAWSVCESTAEKGVAWLAYFPARARACLFREDAARPHEPLPGNVPVARLPAVPERALVALHHQERAEHVLGALHRRDHRRAVNVEVDVGGGVDCGEQQQEEEKRARHNRSRHVTAARAHIGWISAQLAPRGSARARLPCSSASPAGTSPPSPCSAASTRRGTPRPSGSRLRTPCCTWPAGPTPGRPGNSTAGRSPEGAAQGAPCSP